MKFMKRLSLFLLVAVLLVTMIPSAFAANSFTDVRSTDWFSDAVSYVQERGLMSGTSADALFPERADNPRDAGHDSVPRRRAAGNDRSVVLCGRSGKRLFCKRRGVGFGK